MFNVFLPNQNITSKINDEFANLTKSEANFIKYLASDVTDKFNSKQR